MWCAGRGGLVLSRLIVKDLEAGKLGIGLVSRGVCENIFKPLEVEDAGLYSKGQEWKEVSKRTFLK